MEDCGLRRKMQGNLTGYQTSLLKPVVTTGVEAGNAMSKRNRGKQ